MKYLVSACLTGVKCRYNGESSYIHELADLVVNGTAVTFCPELLGGLPVPRACCELQRDSAGNISAIGDDDRDYTLYFLKGAELSLKLAEENGVTSAIMKSRSPSCGYGAIYDGTFSGRIIDGNGITAELFINNGIKILTENDIAVITGKIKEG